MYRVTHVTGKDFLYPAEIRTGLIGRADVFVPHTFTGLVQREYPGMFPGSGYPWYCEQEA